MSADISQPVVTASFATSITSGGIVATGVLEKVNEYAPVIGLALSLSSIMLAMLFFIINYRRALLVEERNSKLMVGKEAQMAALIKELVDMKRKDEGVDDA